jgi:hypothetical protein
LEPNSELINLKVITLEFLVRSSQSSQGNGQLLHIKAHNFGTDAIPPVTESFHHVDATEIYTLSQTSREQNFDAICCKSDQPRTKL